MGLGIDCTAFIERGLISAETKEVRDRAFYTCFVLDKSVTNLITRSQAEVRRLWSFHAGRAAVLTMPVHQINMFGAPSASMQDDVAASIGQGPSLPDPARNSLTGDDRSWQSTTFRETVKLCHIAERILKTAVSRRARFHLTSS